MMALTIMQPYASLIAVESKRIETRCWPAPSWMVGQRIAIHAGKGDDYWPLARTEPFRTHIAAALEAGTLATVDGEMPIGCVVATAILDRCAPITDAGTTELERTNPDERAFGGYDLSAGARFAWVLRDVERLPEPVPARGGQKLWNLLPETVDAMRPQARLL